MIVTVERTWENLNLKASLQDLRDSFLFFLTDQVDFGIGTIIAGVPPNEGTLITNPSSIALLGTKDLNLAKIIVRNLCKNLEKPIVGFVDLKTTIPEIKLGKMILEILGDLIKAKKKSEKEATH